MRSVLFTSILCALCAAPAVAAPARHVISETEVAAAVNGAGMHVEPSQIAFLSEVLASTDNPQLTVRSIEPQGNGRTFARIECTGETQCLPFIVAIQLRDVQHQSDSSATLVRPDLHTARMGMAPAPPAVLPGSKAVLLLDSGPVHISIPVICLERGSQGQMIRVTDRQRRVSYTGRVVSAGLLKGSF